MLIGACVLIRSNMVYCIKEDSKRQNDIKKGLIYLTFVLVNNFL